WPHGERNRIRQCLHGRNRSFLGAVKTHLMGGCFRFNQPEIAWLTLFVRSQHRLEIHTPIPSGLSPAIVWLRVEDTALGQRVSRVINIVLIVIPCSDGVEGF